MKMKTAIGQLVKLKASVFCGEEVLEVSHRCR